MPLLNHDYDYLIIGGGLVGAAVAYGLSQSNERVAVLDEGDRALRASRGNFGLVWVQGKGADNAAYARWSGYAADQWQEFNTGLQGASGVDTGYERPGGMEFCISEEEWDARSDEMERVSAHTDGAFEYEMLEHAALKRRIPQIGNDVIGASFSPQDGHVNPLYLLRAMHQCMDQNGVRYHANCRTETISFDRGEFVVSCASGEFSANKIVLAAGLDNQRLGAMLDMRIPISALRGQILVSEKLPAFLHYPTLHVRQTREGGVQIGDSHEAVDLDDGTRGQVIAGIAKRAVTMFPHLHATQLLRAWGALRVMTPDGCPIYQRSRDCPSAFAISTHSGVSLAAAHAGVICDWVRGAAEHPLIAHFGSERFDADLS
ncbi:MAG: FAD-dependent oxidoreductase [Pseudomonadota bacterium]